jgi:uncharacterized protein (TIGR02599 family)
MSKANVLRLDKAFTLVEVLVAIAVLAILTGIILLAINSTQRAISLAAGSLSAFAEARFANDTLTSKIGQATLNTYWDYDSPIQPTKYQRTSELQFCCGTTGNALFSSSQLFSPAASFPTGCVFFEAPLGVTQSINYNGLETVMNACGYYIQFSSDSSDMPSFLSSLVAPRYRFRLKEWQPPSDNFTLYAKTSGNSAYDATDWINLTSNARTIAENVVALVILPRLSTQEDPTGATLSPNYFYDSRTTATTTPSNTQKNQLPPLIQVIMVAIDEPSAVKLAAKNGSAMPNLFPPQIFTDSTKLEADLTAFEGILAASPGNATGNTIPLNYIVMNSVVSIHSSKWSAF